MGTTRRRQILAVVLFALLASACAQGERRGIRVTPTSSTAETGVRVLVDNCPGPSSLELSVREDVLWEIEAPQTETPDADSPDAEALLEEQPGLREFLVGETPDGWTTLTPLEAPLEAGTRYTIRTRPDGQSIDFATPDLQAGLLFDGEGRVQFNPDLINVECSEPADVAGFVRNVGVLAALGVTASALVLVALILVLFVITQRFSRVRALQRKGAPKKPKTPKSQKAPKAPKTQNVGARPRK